MNKAVETYKNSRLRKFIKRNNKYAPLLFFISGFIFDTLTLGRIDRVYDITVLSLHMTLLSVALFVYNRKDDNVYKDTLFKRFEIYLPLAIQFFFGGLSSAFVIYFSRSVSLSKTLFFFGILVALLVANEFLKKRISNKYLQFGIYFFVSFTFFTFMIPVIIKEMNTLTFIFSGLVSLGTTLTLLTIIYFKSPSTRLEISLKKMIGIIVVIYVSINTFYFTNLIPPVPLALETGIVAYEVEKENGNYEVTYAKDDWYVLWRNHQSHFYREGNEKVFIFASIFAPTEIKKSIYHRWKFYNTEKEEWIVTDNIAYEITGGRNEGYRGYTFKNNVFSGLWEVDVLTDEGQILGVIDFEITDNPKHKVIKTIESF